LQRDATNVTKNVKINLDLVHFVQISVIANPNICLQYFQQDISVLQMEKKDLSLLGKYLHLY
jgi:hypothetical protein